MTRNSSFLWLGLALAGSVSLLALTGCPALLTGSPSTTTATGDTTTASDAVNAINDLSTFSVDQSTQQSTLASAADNTSGGYSAMALASYRIQDVNGSYAGPLLPQGAVAYPVAAPATTSMGNLVPATSSLAPNGTYTWSWPAGSTTLSVYQNNNPTNAAGGLWNPIMGTGPYATYTVTDHPQGTLVSDEFVSPYATSSFAVSGVASNPILPAPFNSNPIYGSMTGQLGVREFALNFYHYSGNGTATGYRWAVFNQPSAGTNWQYVAFNRALQITRTNPASGSTVTLDEYDVLDNYQAEPSGYGLHVHRVPLERIIDMTIPGTSYHMHRDETFANGVWSGSGTFTNGSGATFNIATTWNPSLFTRTKIVSWTNSKGNVVLTEDFNADRSGTGTVTLDGSPVATLQWATDGQGTVDIGGTVKTFHVH